MADQRAQLREMLASAIGAAAEAASAWEPPASRTGIPPRPSPETAAAPLQRPWSMAAAMEPVAAPPAEPRPAHVSTGLLPPPPPPPPSDPPPGAHFPTLIIGSALAALIAVAVVVLRLFPGGAPPRAAQAHPTDRIALTAVRPVAPTASSGGALLPTEVSFPAGTAIVDIEVTSGGGAGQAPVTVAVSLGQPAKSIIDATYLLNPSGDTVISLTPPAGAFTPGDYAVAITAGGAQVGATSFDVR